MQSGFNMTGIHNKKFEAAMKDHGSVNIWFKKSSLKQDTNHKKMDLKHSDLSILVACVLRKIFNQPFRQTISLYSQITQMLDIPWRLPNHTTLVRREKKLEGLLPVVCSSQKDLEVVITDDGVQIVEDSEALNAMLRDGEWSGIEFNQSYVKLINGSKRFLQKQELDLNVPIHKLSLNTQAEVEDEEEYTFYRKSKRKHGNYDSLALLRMLTPSISF